MAQSGTAKKFYYIGTWTLKKKRAKVAFHMVDSSYNTAYHTEQQQQQQ